MTGCKREPVTWPPMSSAKERDNNGGDTIKGPKILTNAQEKQRNKNRKENKQNKKENSTPSSDSRNLLLLHYTPDPDLPRPTPRPQNPKHPARIAPTQLPTQASGTRDSLCRYFLAASSQEIAEALIRPFSFNEDGAYPFGMDYETVGLRNRRAGEDLEAGAVGPAEEGVIGALGSFGHNSILQQLHILRNLCAPGTDINLAEWIPIREDYSVEV